MASLSSMIGVLRGEDTPTPPSRNDADLDMDMSNPTTPKRQSFAGLPGQLPLPDEPLSVDLQTDKLKSIEGYGGRADSLHPSQGQDMDDIEMGEADADTVVDDEASDDESVLSESQRSAKKKKGQRFFCTEFPPCQLSFTRSEHLARHIRKHTGERPFQCHCSRRFSRLDNLRQHAQTVHVNEEIPGDSLAATSTRFQRQIRTDRVRPTSSRSRGSTLNGGQTPTNARGHGRNLSTSSIGSVGSSYAMSEEPRRRPPTLAIATEGLKRPHEDIEHYQTENQYQSQNGIGTPTSQTLSSAFGSPGYNSGYMSPTSNISRASHYGPMQHNRRLSVPSGPNPFQSSMAYAPGYYTPISSQASLYSGNTSGFASPTSSIMSPGRRDSETEIEYRRRTWHPSTQTNYTQRPATSGLSYHQTPDEPRPAISQQPAANQITRLPGIESFDHAVSSARQIDQTIVETKSRPTSQAYDSGLQQGLHRLDIASASNSAPIEQHWHQPPAPPAYAHPTTSYAHHHISMPEVSVTPRRNKRQAWYGGPVGPSSSFLQPTFSSLRPSPEESGSNDVGAPTQSNYNQEYHPVELPHPALDAKPHEFPPPRQYPPQQPYFYPAKPQSKPALPTRADSGFGPYQQTGSMTALSHQAPPPPLPPPPPHTYHLQAGHDARFANGYIHARPERENNDMGRLEALVAVATSENRAVEEQR